MSETWLIPVTAVTPFFLAPTVTVTTTTTYITQAAPSSPPPSPQMRVLVADVCVLFYVSYFLSLQGVFRAPSSQGLLLCSRSGDNRRRKGTKCLLYRLLYR